LSIFGFTFDRCIWYFLQLQTITYFYQKINHMKHNNLFILSNGRVAAINKKDGQIIWEVKLRQYLSSSVAYVVGQISVEDNKIFVGVSGILLCLSTKDGSLIWKNELKGWGFQFVSMANANDNAANAAAIKANAAATSAAAV
jgi:outer membrane protein assembly factor BamB